jgi:predicted dehydrogenase
MKKRTRRDFMKQAALGTAALVMPAKEALASAMPTATRSATDGFAKGLAPAHARVLGANDRVRVGMIGVGGRGQDLLREIPGVPNTQLVAIADVFSRRRDEAKKMAPGIETMSDHRRLLERNDIDAVIVASPLHIHALHFLDTLAAGKDLYSEKTMTWSVPEADECLAAAKKSDRVVQIGLQHESGGALADTRAWIGQGIVGKVTQVEAWMSRNTPHGKGQWVRAVPPDCTAENVDWNAFLNGRPDTGFDGYRFMNWRLFWEFSGGNITENMVHQISWIISALNLDLPTAAYMSGGIYSEKDGREVPDTIVVTLDYPGDVVVTWQSTFSNSHYGLGERLLGSDGTVEHTEGVTDMVHGESAEQIRYYPEKVNRPGGEAIAGHSRDENHMANWIDCVRSRKQPNAPVEAGYRSAIACHMANLAYRSKERITLDQARALKPRY